jgi:hypothetical protein
MRRHTYHAFLFGHLRCDQNLAMPIPTNPIQFNKRTPRTLLLEKDTDLHVRLGESTARRELINKVKMAANSPQIFERPRPEV